ncbi:hypothetical protein HNP55_004328 [Paucibacter oligotrophus]|uniref:Lipoprotein n=1 Tax=Roseateles oligotrophus TaxID=1769250 RepID=A0A840LCA0_9BURK|nr:hypothetical protein [Roseateles oligotrophus]MBB4845776.1 hypothetical protein [Roseateles oligotrophus]
MASPCTRRVRSHTYGLIPVLLTLAACSSTIKQEGLEQRAAMATGHPVGSFTITDKVEAGGGRIEFNVKARDGANFQCYMYSATAFQKAMSFGQTPHSDAICTQMGKGSGASPAAPSCNALLKAAGKC